jgi:cold shock CspA family protein
VNHRQDVQLEFISTTTEAEPSPESNGNRTLGQVLRGVIKKKKTERGFGFIYAPSDGRDYFFHFTDLQAGLEFDEIEEGLAVEFTVKREPAIDKAGAAVDVHKQGSSVS